MAANRFTTAELLTAITRSGHVPQNQTPFDTTGLLALADEETQTALVQQILSVRENYFLTYSSVAVNATGVYDIPSRAVAGALADLHLVNGTDVTQVTRTEIGELSSTTTSPSGGYSFFIVGNHVNVTPVPTSGTIRLYYYVRPNNLVATSGAAQITAINGLVATVSAMPTTITTATPVDVIADQPPFNLLGTDVSVTISGTTATFSALPSGLAVGDWIALAGQTPVPLMPVEFRPLLALRVALRVAIAQGYEEKAKLLKDRLAGMEKSLFEVISPRVTEQLKQISPSYEFLCGARSGRNWQAS